MLDRRVRECQRLAYPSHVVHAKIDAVSARLNEMEQRFHGRDWPAFMLDGEVAELRKRIEDAEALLLPPTAPAANE